VRADLFLTVRCLSNKSTGSHPPIDAGHLSTVQSHREMAITDLREVVAALDLRWLGALPKGGG
jgi:hypothetical protein